MSKRGFKRLIAQKHRELIQEMARTHKYFADFTSSANKKEAKDKSQDSNDKKGKQTKPGKSSKDKRKTKNPTHRRKQRVG